MQDTWKSHIIVHVCQSHVIRTDCVVVKFCQHVHSISDMWGSDEQFARDPEDKSTEIGWDGVDSMLVILHHEASKRILQNSGRARRSPPFFTNITFHPDYSPTALSIGIDNHIQGIDQSIVAEKVPIVRASSVHLTNVEFSGLEIFIQKSIMGSGQRVIWRSCIIWLKNWLGALGVL